VGPTFHLEEDHKPGDLPRFFFLQNEFDGLDDMIHIHVHVISWA
jgi:hypothetical protein